jgi:hypothetical protein
MMRTTLTLDSDVSARLERERRRRHIGLKSLVNEVLRAGLDALDTAPRQRASFKTTGFDLGASVLGSLDNIEEVLARAEGEDHR